MMDSTSTKTRTVRRLTIEEDRCGNWRIRLHFNKGRCKLMGETWDTHTSALLAASGIPLKQNWYPLDSAKGAMD